MRHESREGRAEPRYLTTEEAAAYLRFPSLKAFYEFLRRHNLPVLRRGRHLLFDRQDLDAWNPPDIRTDERGWHETWNDCPACGRAWKDATPTPQVLHRTRLCEACARDTHTGGGDPMPADAAPNPAQRRR